MSESEFPYTRWRLSPSFRPVEVEIVEEHKWWGSHEPYGKTATGKSFSVSELFVTKQEAIEHGRNRLSDQEAKILKLQQGVAKKRAALDKAEAA